MNNKIRLQKFHRYRTMLLTVGTLRDGLGLPVDPGIRKTVALLNLLGHTTTASCEGHRGVSHGLLTPWVDVSFGTRGRADAERRLRVLVRSFWQYRYRVRADHRLPDGLTIHMDELGAGRRKRIRLGSNLETDLYYRISADKKKLPSPV